MKCRTGHALLNSSSETALSQKNPEVSSLGIYIHWPFCAAKCPYCDFNSHVRHDGIDENRFLSAYRNELSYLAGLAPGRTVESVFFGGGTPSLMSPECVGGLIDAVADYWPIGDDVEITLEANPSSVEADWFRGYAGAGVNRISLGVQALNDKDLKALGRLHNRDEALAALAIARRHFRRVSFDLIYARPGQSADDWRDELAQALALRCDHLSLYQLTIEPGTPFATLYRQGRLQVPGEDRCLELYEITQELCEASGLRVYEISNYARPGQESRHNLIYWRYGEYAGAGPGAHSRLEIDGMRYALCSTGDPESWIELALRQGHGAETCEVLSLEAQAQEMLMMGLRLREGVDLIRMEALTGYRIGKCVADSLIDDGLICVDEEVGRFSTTVRGRLVLNSVVGILAGALVA